MDTSTRSGHHENEDFSGFSKVKSKNTSPKWSRISQRSFWATLLSKFLVEMAPQTPTDPKSGCFPVFPGFSIGSQDFGATENEELESDCLPGAVRHPELRPWYFGFANTQWISTYTKDMLEIKSSVGQLKNEELESDCSPGAVRHPELRPCYFGFASTNG